MRMTKLTAQLLIGGLALYMTSCCCFGPAPGKGRKARAGFRAAAPVILALERFHKSHGQYPATLDELVPTYLPDTTALLVRGKVKPLHSPHAAATASPQGNSLLGVFWYHQTGDTYDLSFQYTGPGMNSCSYDPKTKTWLSSGYY